LAETDVAELLDGVWVDIRRGARQLQWELVMLPRRLRRRQVIACRWLGPDRVARHASLRAGGTDADWAGGATLNRQPLWCNG
jgi:hypothetical protein